MSHHSIPILTLPHLLLFLLILSPTPISALKFPLVKRPSSSDESWSFSEDPDASDDGRPTGSDDDRRDSIDEGSIDLGAYQYEPPICSGLAFGEIADVESCRAARWVHPMNTAMGAPQVFVQFGPRGSPGTQIETPFYLAAGRPEIQCVIAISNSPDINTPDRALWFALFSAATAIIQQCVAGLGVGGYIPGEGHNGNIAVTIFSWQGGSNTGNDPYPEAIALQDYINDATQSYRESPDSLQQLQQAGNDPVVYPLNRKPSFCHAGETAYVREGVGCCPGSGFSKLGIGQRIWLFGTNAIKQLTEVGVCLLEKAPA